MPSRLIPAALVAALAATPAAAQFAPRSYGSAPVTSNGPSTGWRETDRIRAAIHDGRETGQLTRREARQLRREARRVDAISARYLSGGLSGSEAAELQHRTLALQDAVTARRSGNPAPEER